MENDLEARVFISCGQNKNTDEVRIANEIAEALHKLGYDPYIAVNEQTLRGFKENLFQRIRDTEYFLFIDFKREVILNYVGRGNSLFSRFIRLIAGKCRFDSHRGSLFSHQEFAIAAYLEKEVIAFQEKGVINRDGIISVLQANSTEFEDRHTLAGLVVEKVKQRWDPKWKNELIITRDVAQYADAQHPPAHQPRHVRYFHLAVTNANKFRTAFNCYAYLENIVSVAKNERIEIKDVEYKWRGAPLPNVIIPPSKTRELDAFMVYLDSPSQIRMGCFTDSPAHMHHLPSPGEYLLTFGVHSENFREARSTFYLKSDGTGVENVIFKAIPTKSA